MSDDRPPRPPRRPRDLLDHEIVEVPETERSFPRMPPRPREPFQKLVQTPGDVLGEVLSVQRKMALQMDGFGGMMNRRFDLFHEELALLRSSLDAMEKLVKEGHAPRLDKVEASLGQKAAKGGGIIAVLVVAAPLIADALPKYKPLIDAILGLP